MDDDEHEPPLMYDPTKMSVETFSIISMQQMSDHMARRGQRQFAALLAREAQRANPARSQAPRNANMAKQSIFDRLGVPSEEELAKARRLPEPPRPKISPEHDRRLETEHGAQNMRGIER